MEEKECTKNEMLSIKGFDLELQQLPNVAQQFANYDIAKLKNDFPETGKETEQIIIKSRKYLNLLLDKAIEKYTKTEKP